MSEATVRPAGVRVRFLGSGDSFGSGGRFMTCILVETPTTRFLLDCGDTSLVAMRAQGVEVNDLDAVLLTHLHGDHCAGVPFMLMDGMLASKRQRKLTVAGPPGLVPRMDAIREALFPGSRVMTPRFEVEWVEMEPGRAHRVLDLTVTPFPAVHTPETHPTILRVGCGGRVITYTGDTDWTEALVPAADGADLLIAESYFYDKPIKMHLNYATLKAHLPALSARRVVLTHMSRDMLAHVDDVPEQCAHDGLVIDL